MFENVLGTMDAYAADWTSNTVISGIVSNLQNGVNALLEGEQDQKAGSIIATEKKTQARTTLEETAVAISNAGKAYAVAANDIDLKGVCRLTVTKLRNAKDVDLIAYCQNLYDSINSSSANLAPYGASVANITALQTAITNFTTLTGKPATAISAVSAATQSIAVQVKNLKTLLNDQLDPLMTQFKTSNVNFYNQYESSRVIHDIGVHHTVILKGFIYGEGSVALAGALVKLTGSAVRQKITEAGGLYNFIRLHTGTYTCTISAPGYVTQTTTITVIQNGTVETNFTLVAVATQ